MRSTLYYLIAYGFYPAWLLAGAGDYWCHRRSAIERTSGQIESRYHLAQFATIAIIVLGIALFEGSAALFVIVIAAGLAHTSLSYFDVRFTEKRRYISPLEQHVHAVLDVIPLAAIALWIVLEWRDGAGTWGIALRDPMLSPLELTAVLVSVFIVAGGPVLEEFWRTVRVARERRRSDHSGLATIK